MAQSAIKSALPVAPGNRDLSPRSSEWARARPHVILVTGPAEPGPGAMHAASWLGRRLGAWMLVVAAVEYPPPRDEWVNALVTIARSAVSATAGRLVRESVEAEGIVVAVPDRQGPAAIDDLADAHEAKLVAVTSARRSWFRVFPGSALGHHLTRTGHRPVRVIPDHRPRLRGPFLGRLDARRGGTSWQRTH